MTIFSPDHLWEKEIPSVTRGNLRSTVLGFCFRFLKCFSLGRIFFNVSVCIICHIQKKASRYFRFYSQFFIIYMRIISTLYKGIPLSIILTYCSKGSSQASPLSHVQDYILGLKGMDLNFMSTNPRLKVIKYCLIWDNSRLIHIETIVSADTRNNRYARTFENPKRPWSHYGLFSQGTCILCCFVLLYYVCIYVCVHQILFISNLKLIPPKTYKMRT